MRIVLLFLVRTCCLPAATRIWLSQILSPVHFAQKRARNSADEERRLKAGQFVPRLSFNNPQPDRRQQLPFGQLAFGRRLRLRLRARWRGRGQFGRFSYTNITTDHIGRMVAGIRQPTRLVCRRRERYSAPNQSAHSSEINFLLALKLSLRALDLTKLFSVSVSVSKSARIPHWRCSWQKRGGRMRLETKTPTVSGDIEILVDLIPVRERQTLAREWYI